MFLSMRIIVFVLIIVTNLTSSAPIDKSAVKEYLETYGYVEPSSGRTGRTDSEEMIEGVKFFQYTYGLEQTGELDNVTLEEMSRPRCGVPPRSEERGRIHGQEIGARIREDFNRWTNYNLTYYIINLPPRRSGMSVEEVTEVIQWAFNSWSTAVPIYFRRVASRPSHLEVGWHGRKGLGNGDRGFSNMGTSGHAFIPPDGKIHLNDAIDWSKFYNSGKLTLWQTLTHEIGHALGLFHSRLREAIMFSSYHEIQPYRLAQDDIDGITLLYGSYDFYNKKQSKKRDN